MSTETFAPQAPGHDELVARARGLAPLLREWAPRHEAARRVSDEAIAAMREAGLFRIVQPAACGGWDMHPRALFDCAREVARADTAAGWILCLAGVHPWLLGMFEPRFQDEVFAHGRDAVVPVLSGGVGRDVQVAVDGDALRLSGRWLYASGVDVADWLCVMVAVPTDGGPPQQRLAAVPRSAFTVDDASWQVASMRGTGSKDVTLNDCRVPLYRTLCWADAQRGVYPGQARNHGPMYRMPLNAVFALCTAAGVVGGAFGLLDAVIALGRKRIANANSAAQAEDRHNQIELGQGAAQIHMAHRLIVSDIDEMHAQASRHEAFTQEQRARYRADAALASRMAVAAAGRLVATCGGAILPQGPVERFFRDIHGMASHFLLQAEVGGELYGKTLYGLELPANTRL
jgi:alkylation response protein AidB-like acyl-CoA dehydrogenase